MDGTLVDSEEYHWRAWQETMDAEGIAITREHFLATFGLRNDSIVPQWLGPDATTDQIQRIGDAKEARYRRLIQQSGLPPSPGADKWVKSLHQDGWLQAIASSAPRRNVEVVLESLGLSAYFQAIASAEDVQKGKPDPQVFLVAASRVAVLPSRCIVVEDAAAGVEAARRAGMRSIGLSRDDALEADVVVPSLAALPDNVFRSLIADA